MKIFRSIVWISALMLLACTRQGADDSGALVLQSINASAGEAVKTVVSGSSVLWSPNEKVNVFAEGASYTFTGTMEKRLHRPHSRATLLLLYPVM
jgi:hypothetical protein